MVRCTYLEIPQAPETLGVLGSRPWWIWGFEHGVNACGVAIGNEALHTREMPAETGLLGMDLLRLGLERGRTADDAKRVITDLRAKLPAVTCPVLLLHGDTSPFIPVSVMVAMHAALPDSRLQVFAHARHGLPFSHARQCAESLKEFLESVRQR